MARSKEWPEPYTRGRNVGSRTRLGADGRYHYEGVQDDALWAQGIGQTMAIPTPPPTGGIGFMTIGTTFIVA